MKKVLYFFQRQGYNNLYFKKLEKNMKTAINNFLNSADAIIAIIAVGVIVDVLNLI
jgi:hypothetical protein